MRSRCVSVRNQDAVMRYRCRDGARGPNLREDRVATRPTRVPVSYLKHVSRSLLGCAVQFCLERLGHGPLLPVDPVSREFVVSARCDRRAAAAMLSARACGLIRWLCPGIHWSSRRTSTPWLWIIFDCLRIDLSTGAVIVRRSRSNTPVSCINPRLHWLSLKIRTTTIFPASDEESAYFFSYCEAT